MSENRDAPANSAWIADQVGVTRAAVSNWVKRGALPEDLRPEMALGGGPVWRESQVPGLRAWHIAHARGARSVVLEGLAPAQLLPGDLVVSVDDLVPGDVTITVRRFSKREKKEKGA